MGFMKPKAPVIPEQETVAPTAPVEEASVEIGDEDKKKRARTGKAKLKVPMSTKTSTGLKA
jgi:hypothetical protein